LAAVSLSVLVVAALGMAGLPALAAAASTVGPSPTTDPSATTAPGAATTATGAATCPPGNASVTQFSYVFNGKTHTTHLNTVHAGDHVVVNFTIAPGCTHEQISLVSYEAPESRVIGDHIKLQKLFSQDTGFFEPGSHSLHIDIPPCFFQADFVRGPVIEHLTRDNQYHTTNRLIDAGNGGDRKCEHENPPTPSPSPTSSTQAAATPAVTSEVKAAETSPNTGRREDAITGLLAVVMVLMGIALLAETRARGPVPLLSSAPSREWRRPDPRWVWGRLQRAARLPSAAMLPSTAAMHRVSATETGSRAWSEVPPAVTETGRPADITRGGGSKVAIRTSFGLVALLMLLLGAALVAETRRRQRKPFR
jgi:hypothetical protein